MFKNSLPIKWGFRSKEDSPEKTKERYTRAGLAGAATKRAAKLNPASN